jgi:putative phosphoribosyl transferase
MEKSIRIPVGKLSLEGNLKVPEGAHGLVLFAHGSGSSRFSPRNQFVANVLNMGGLATLLIDLLSHQEDEIHQSRFDIDLLTDRLAEAVRWLKSRPETQELSLGLFGSSTGAAAALRVAAAHQNEVDAVVSRGGRPDLAMSVLREVLAPTLFIVGGNDVGVIELNREAYEKLTCPKRFDVIPGATHLFEEPGALNAVAMQAKEWLRQHLVLSKGERR